MSENAHKRWSKDISNYDIPHLRLRQVARIVNEIGPTHYIDLGCAKGTLRTLTPNLRYTGIDFVQQNVDFEFYSCDFNSNSLPNEINNVELFTCSGLLEYIHDVPEFLIQINQKLISKGRFVLTYFNMNHISRISNLIKGNTFQVHPDWRNFYSYKDLRQKLFEGGFNVLSSSATVHSLRGSPSVDSTLELKVALPKFRFFSYLFAHQIIFICEKK